MKAENSGQQVHAVIVGSSADEFVRHAVKLFCGCEIDYSLCEDIYSAAAQLAKNSRRYILITGRFENLNKEKGWIFQKAVEGRFSCCCFVGSSLAASWQKTVNLKGAGIFIINGMEEFETVVMKILQNDLASVTRITKAGSVVFNKEEFATTKAEIDALLGG